MSQVYLLHSQAKDESTVVALNNIGHVCVFVHSLIPVI